MGYFLNNNIATVCKPQETAWANSPNFVSFTSTTDLNNTPLISDVITVREIHEMATETLEIIFSRKDLEEPIIIMSTYDPQKVDQKTFLLVKPNSDVEEFDETVSQARAEFLTTQNIKECLMKQSFIRNNYEVRIPSTQNAGTLSYENKVYIEAKGKGKQYEFKLDIVSKKDTQNPSNDENDIIVGDYIAPPKGKVLVPFYWDHFEKQTIEIRIKDATQTFVFKSTKDPAQVANNIFLKESISATLTKDRAIDQTLINIEACMNANFAFASNYSIQVDAASKQIELTARKFGTVYNLAIQVETIYQTVPASTQKTWIIDLEGRFVSGAELDITINKAGTQYTKKLEGSSTIDTGNHFLVVDQSATVSYSQAKTKTLENLMKCMKRQSDIDESLDVVFDYWDTNSPRILASYRLGAMLVKGELDLSSNYMNVAYADTEMSFKFARNVQMTNVDFDPNDLPSGNTNPDPADSIDGGAGNLSVTLDIYTNHPYRRKDTDTLQYGNYLASVSKSYFGKPIWFELSALLSRKVGYSTDFLRDEARTKWQDAGTMLDYRFVAKRGNGKVTEPFYVSAPLYVVNGYNRTLEPISFDEDNDGYAYLIDFDQDFRNGNFRKLKPLSTHFDRTHIEGQKQYFSFIHNFNRLDATNDPCQATPSVGICYKLYTQMGTYMGEEIQLAQNLSQLAKVNTARLDLDQFLPQYKGRTIGRIEAYLCRWHKNKCNGQPDEPEVLISKPMVFRILPKILNEVHDFAFLNQVGGWDSVNFGGKRSYDFKPTASTIFKTLLPHYQISTQLETVYSVGVKEQMACTTLPISRAKVDWLRQMAASTAVYELSTSRYIVIEEMNLNRNSTDDTYQVEMKYRYTDTYNNK